TDLPLGVGLGVRTGAQAAEIAGFADAVIVGSSFVSAAERGGPAAVAELAGELAAGVREAAGQRQASPA
ncbi:MAG: tryptophan synthase subunit alpha, partial [Nakamurella sp.]